ncbi:hypothetical protein B0T16DRAFT_51045 [Cercophora newfieldiana]|uniref:BHLH domain-containing protein n=1 Tax=Cercophora newfieldiana TaxID=92897 RepID=A0AA39YR17_9PEZI|nr:hypothetical protein B0T16DRAFT_51045 [Cercophora newfieldiana]
MADRCKTLVGDFLGYPTSTMFDHTAFPTTLVDSSQSPVLCFDGSSLGFVESTEVFAFGGQSSGLQSPTVTDPTGFTGYGVCSSPLDSLWSRSTATTPSEDVFAGYFPVTREPCHGTGLAYPFVVGGMNWLGPPLVHPDAVDSGPPSADHSSSRHLLGARFSDQPAANTHHATKDETPLTKRDFRLEGGSWDEAPVESVSGPPTIEEDVSAKRTSVAHSAAPPRGKKPKSRKFSAKKGMQDNASAGPSLRTAARRHKRAESTSKPGESVQAQRARASHNQVEKEYRTRLHGHFEQLLKVLPDEDDLIGEGQSESAGGGSGRHKRLSKAEVLQKARLHIRDLEEDIKRQRREVSGLQRGFEQGVAGSQ